MELAESITASLKELSSSGAPWTGDARYVVVEEDRPIPPGYLGYRNAAPWPLAEAVADVAIGAAEAETYEAVVSHLVTAADAEALRSLRSRFLAGEVGFEAERFIPIETADGARYRLYVRDAIDLEDAQGRLPWRREASSE